MRPDRSVRLSAAQRRWRVLLAGGLGLVVVGFSFLNPENFPSPACTFRELTGYSCFTCGLTRSLLAVAHGHLSSSLGYHLLGPLIFLGMITAMVALGAEAVAGRRLNPARTAKFWPGVLVTLVLVWMTYGGIRLALELAG
jgi:putative Mn2+ efflux pump MntP